MLRRPASAVASATKGGNSLKKLPDGSTVLSSVLASDLPIAGTTVATSTDVQSWSELLEPVKGILAAACVSILCSTALSGSGSSANVRCTLAGRVSASVRNL